MNIGFLVGFVLCNHSIRDEKKSEQVLLIAILPVLVIHFLVRDFTL